MRVALGWQGRILAKVSHPPGWSLTFEKPSDEFFVDPLFGLEVRMENGLVELERAMEKNEVSEFLCLAIRL
jgi:hypothetical protein